MHTDIPEEIQGKLTTLDKDKTFFKRMWAPSKWDIPTAVSGVICILLITILMTTLGSYNIFPVIYILLIILIVYLFKLRKIYTMYSNALDIIKYYRNKQAK